MDLPAIITIKYTVKVNKVIKTIHGTNNADEEVDLESIPTYMEFRPIGEVMNLCQINVEGLFTDKYDFLGKLLSSKKTDVLYSFRKPIKLMNI